MSSAMYNNYRAEALQGLRTPGSETIKVFAVSNGYTFSASHTSVNDVPAANRMHTSRALSTKTFTAGTFDADDLTLTAASSASAINALIVYTEAGTSASSTLMVYIDTGTGFPVTTNGGDIIVQWDSGANKIFTL